MVMTEETIKDSSKIAKSLRDLADGIDSGEISVVPETSILETQWTTKSLQNFERIMSGYFRLSLVYYDKNQDNTKAPTVINLEIHDGSHGMKDNLGK